MDRLEQGTQLVKLDIKDAYRMLPVHPADYHLLGIEWRSNTGPSLGSYSHSFRSTGHLTTMSVSMLVLELTSCGGRHSFRIGVVSILHFFQSRPPLLRFFSDASGIFGCGTFSHPHGWFQLQWLVDCHSIHIIAKELVPKQQHGDHNGPVNAFASGQITWQWLAFSSPAHRKTPYLYTCCIAFMRPIIAFRLPEHIPGMLNTAADALSRDNLSLFHSLVPQSQQVSLPQAVLDLLVNNWPDWDSQAWTHLFTCSLI